MKKLISDFDGVLTTLTHEVQRVKEIFYEVLGMSDAPTWQKRVETLVLSDPSRWGWESQKRITAYCDEDGFIFNNALGVFLDHIASQGEVSSLFQSLSIEKCRNLIGIKHLSCFQDAAQWAYEQMVSEVKEGQAHPLESATGPVFEKLLNAGTQIVVVSNSGTARILDIFGKARISGFEKGHSTHLLGEQTLYPIKVLGGAEKFTLGDEARPMQFGGRVIDCSRPKYDSILRREIPDAVIGDVFSLDLALPLQLGLEGVLGAQNGLDLILRKQSYTPQWVQRAIADWRDPRVRLHLLENLEDLPKILLK